jgi:hypothetical protein
MKHLEAGLIVGGIALGVLLLSSAVWAVFNYLVGPYIATAFVVGAILAAILATIIDWKTERRV